MDILTTALHCPVAGPGRRHPSRRRAARAVRPRHPRPQHQSHRGRCRERVQPRRAANRARSAIATASLCFGLCILAVLFGIAVILYGKRMFGGYTVGAPIRR